MDERSWPGGSSWRSGSWNEKKSVDAPESFKFESERFFSTAPVSRSNDYCPYSLRQSQLSTSYQYDLLLVYDPEENGYYVEKLMEHLRPQNLKIFDFNRDAPPGLPQRKILQSAFQNCRYTCIVITRKFITSFWLQLRTDMSIQDMLDNEQKMYSVIVVVMDPDVKKRDLPLDLMTLSPLFFTERFFENRIKLAFGKEMPLPASRTSDFSKSLDAHDPPKYHDLPTARFDSKPDLNGGTSSYMSSVKGPITSAMNSGSSYGSRVPREHGDGTFVMPPSLFPSSNSTAYDETSLGMHRAVSVTVKSTGSRQPQETSESSSSVTASNQFDSITEAKSFFSTDSSGSVSQTDETLSSSSTAANSELDSITESKNFFTTDSRNENHDSLETEKLGMAESYKEGEFSSSSQTDSGSLPHSSSTRGYSPAFFSLGDPSFIESTASDLSDLEISITSLPVSSQQTEGDHSPPPPASLQRSHSLDRIPVKSNSPNSELSDDSFVSLPANLNHNGGTQSGPNLKAGKKARSMRSLLSIRLSKMSNPFKSKRK